MLIENLPFPMDRRMYQEAQALREAGYEMRVICPKGEKTSRSSFETVDGVRVYRYGLQFEASGVLGYLFEYGWAMVCTFVLMWRVFLTDGFDIVHAANPPDLFFALALPFKLLGKKFVFDQHDLCPESYEVKFGRGLLYKVLCWLEQCSYRTANLIISTNRSYYDITRERGGVPDKKLCIVRSGPDLRRFHEVPPQPELKQGFPYMAVYLGVMGRTDGVDRVITAAHHLIRIMGRMDVLFVCIGKGGYWESLQQLSQRLGVAEYCRFPGRIPDAEVVAYLSSADVCLAPDPPCAMNDLSTMNKILEYMACRRPIVSFALKEARRSAEGAAIYVEKDDPALFAASIDALLKDPEGRARMGDIGFARISRELSWDRSRANLVEAYSRIAGCVPWVSALLCHTPFQKITEDLARRGCGLHPRNGHIMLKAFQHLVKRVVDVVVSSILLVVLAPFFLILALLVKLSSPGPVFYRWRVVGRDGGPFVSYKFRSMYVDADRRKAALLAQNEMSGPVFKIASDPRVTPLGRVLRKYSLDELPQLWSVLTGKMSLVGPRPPLETEYAKFTGRQRLKLQVKPGITCLWQVNGRNEISNFDDWVNLDLQYIKSWSLTLDFKILLKTIPAVVLGKGK